MQLLDSLKYNPNHEPGGSSEGGQFTSGGGGGGGGGGKPDKYGLDRDEQETMFDWTSGAGGKGGWDKLRSDKDGRMEKVLSKMPVHKGTVYRGLELDPKLVSAKLRKGSVYRMDKLSSATKIKNLAISFSDAGLTSHAVVFEVSQKSGREIPTKYTMGKGEQEVVLMKNKRHKIVEVSQAGSKGKEYTLIRMKEL